MNSAGAKIPAEFFRFTCRVILDYASCVATRPPGGWRAHPDQPASAMEQTHGRPLLADCGGCPYSPKADLGKKWSSPSGRLRTQQGIYPIGQNRTVV